jgi:hypothetical protein
MRCVDAREERKKLSFLEMLYNTRHTNVSLALKSAPISSVPSRIHYASRTRIIVAHYANMLWLFCGAVSKLTTLLTNVDSNGAQPLDSWPSLGFRRLPLARMLTACHHAGCLM